MDDKKTEYFSKLVASFVPELAKESIYKTFGSFNRNKIGCVLGGLEIVTDKINPENPTGSADIVNAIMVGVMLSDIYESEEMRKIIFDKYFSILDAAEGKNIINFNEQKNKRLL